MNTIFILLPVHNRKQATARFLDCLRVQSHQVYQLVLIDDGSTDGTARMVEEALPNSVLLHGDGSLWWAGALQLGYRWLASVPADANDLVLIINDDTCFEADFLATAVGLVADRERVMLHAQCHDEQTGDLLDDGVRVSWKTLSFSQVHSTDQVNCLSTRGLFMRLSDFLATGGFRPGLLPHYLSDYEFTIRAQRRGLKPLIDPRLRLQTQRRVAKPSSRDGRFTTLRALFSRKNPADPYAWIMFVVLCSPWVWKPLNLLRVCTRTLLLIVK